MPMRRDCRHYESRTYRSGEIIERCNLNLAPEAPWRCPDECPGYERRMIDVGWQYGSMAQPGRSEPERPEPEGEDVAAVLDELQFVVNAAAPDVKADFERQERKGLFRRTKKGAARTKGKKQGKKKRKKRG